MASVETIRRFIFSTKNTNSDKHFPTFIFMESANILFITDIRTILRFDCIVTRDKVIERNREKNGDSTQKKPFRFGAEFQLGALAT